jgi:hypothetical protein
MHDLHDTLSVLSVLGRLGFSLSGSTVTIICSRRWSMILTFGDAERLRRVSLAMIMTLGRGPNTDSQKQLGT